MTELEKCRTVIFQLQDKNVVYSWLNGIQSFYRPIHAYASIILCVIGTLCNFCNIIVLTRKQMQTPVNMILTAMACCDTVVLFSNLIYTTHYNFIAYTYCLRKHWSYGWAVFLISHANLSLVGHSCSIWLSVMLALLRYMTLRQRGQSMRTPQISLQHSYIAIAFVIVCVTIMNGPNYFIYKIIEMETQNACFTDNFNTRNESAYSPGVSDLALEANCIIFKLAFWTSGIVFKLLPCLLLTLLVWLLMRILTDVKKRRIALLKDKGTKTRASMSGNCQSDRVDRTTSMLLMILVIFLITELPQGIMAVLSGIFSEEFRQHIYNNLGDILDFLSLCNSCATFIIYCSMSTQFREEFWKVFFPIFTLQATPADRYG